MSHCWRMGAIRLHALTARPSGVRSHRRSSSHFIGQLLSHHRHQQWQRYPNPNSGTPTRLFHRTLSLPCLVSPLYAYVPTMLPLLTLPPSSSLSRRSSAVISRRTRPRTNRSNIIISLDRRRIPSLPGLVSPLYAYVTTMVPLLTLPPSSSPSRRSSAVISRRTRPRTNRLNIAVSLDHRRILTNIVSAANRFDNIALLLE